MKILVVGSGGREHAIIKKLSENKKITQIYCTPGNGGISELAECLDIKALDIEGIVAFSKQNAIDLVVVAPDDPLAKGMVDALEEHGIAAFGPTAAAAVIEASKAFSKELMKKYGIPTAAYETFSDCGAALSYLEQSAFPIVIKADGLALGKGVIIAEDIGAAKAAVQEIMQDKIFGTAGNKVVIEEFLTGQEVSVLAFTDGNTLYPMVSAQDHKRVYDCDKGPNTGGMGTFSPSRVYTEEIAELCMHTIFIPTMKAMKAEGRTFKGILYFGLILTEQGPKVIEYNCRFGDPETQVVLPRLKTDLLDIFQAIREERLHEIRVEWKDNAAVCVILASGGYPGTYETGYEIKGIPDALAMENIYVYHAGTKKTAEGTYITAGGRVLGVTAAADSLEQAIERAYAAVKQVSFPNVHYRTDIGVKQ